MSYEVAIIGAGFAGLGAAIKLQQAGIDNVVILEKGTRVGGTWRDNRYPGAACDIPSELYSYSFAPKADWSRVYSGADEILAYIEGLVDRYGLAGKIAFDRTVTAMAFDEATARWTITTKQGEAVTAQSVIVASGPFSGGKVPGFDGLDRYQGHIIHSAGWDHDYDFKGKRVAVIGTGASAVQIIPELVKKAGHVTVFQRTPGWVLPKPNPRNTALVKRLFGRDVQFWLHEAMAMGIVWPSPLTRLLENQARAHLKRQVRDPWMRRQLTPDYRIGCKRVLMSSDYYRALAKDHCKLVTWPIVRFGTEGIVTASGVEYTADCVVMATGFEVGLRGLPYAVKGPGNRDLENDWAGRPQAYKGVSVEGYPNLYLTFGPNSGPGHNSALVYMEAQLDYIAGAIGALKHSGLNRLSVRESRQSRYNRDIQKRLARTNWASGCKSWYLSDDGFNAAMYPGFATQYQREVGRFKMKDYEGA